jgi:hypothetical protein
MSQNKRSNVWNYFDQKGSTVKCRICSAELVYGNGTSSMQSHLKAKHPVAVTAADISSQAQKTMEGFVNPLIRRCPPSRANEITDLLADMVATDILPLSFVDGSVFRTLMEYIEPGYHVPHRKAVTSRLEKRYNDCVLRLKSELKQAQSVAITTDGWTSTTTESYVTVTCHYMLNWKLESVILQTRSVEDRHTAANLAQLLKTSAEEWGIFGKIHACVHDNASNITLANSDEFVNWRSCPCFAHTLQLAICDGMAIAKIDEVVPGCAKLVGHFHHSTVATKALEEKQRVLTVLRHRLIQSCKTRWNSICDMFQRLHEQRPATAAVLGDRAFTKLADERKLALPDSHWRLIEEILPVLQALKCATTLLSSDLNVSCSIIYPVVHGLQTNHLNPCADDCPTVAEFKQAVSASLSRRLVHAADLHLKIPVIAAALDPRHKHLRFLSASQIVAVKQHVLNLLERSLQQQDNEQPENHTPENSAAISRNDIPQNTTEALEALEDYHG